MELQCGQGVSTECEGVSVGSETGFTDAAFKLFVEQAVNVFTGGLTVFISTSTSAFSENMLKGINSLRCAVISFGTNAWNFIASAWWAAKYFGQEGLVEDALDYAFPYICTCNEDLDYFMQVFGATGQSVAVFASCSEAAGASAAANE